MEDVMKQGRKEGKKNEASNCKKCKKQSTEGKKGKKREKIGKQIWGKEQMYKTKLNIAIDKTLVIEISSRSLNACYL